MKSIKKLGLPMVIAGLMVVMAACGGGTSTNNTTSTTKKSDTTATQTKQTTQKQLSGSLVLSGSTALQPLASAAAEQFMNSNPSVSIQVNGGGSGTGLSQVAQGAVQIGNSDVFQEEKKVSGLTDHQVAVIGMAAAINPQVGIKNITTADLIKVFTGKVTNWKQLGGPNLKITLVNRSTTSGTRFVFDKYALNGATPASGITQDASNTVKKIIAQTPGAIGYLALSYFTDNTVLPMSLNGVAATYTNIEDGKYSVWSYEHMYTKGTPTAIAQAFINYMESPAIQGSILTKNGYLQISKMHVKKDATGKITTI